VARKKEERIEFRCSETLYSFIEQQQNKMEEQMESHVPKSEVVRRMITVFMYLEMSPGAELDNVTDHAATFESFLQDL